MGSVSPFVFFSMCGVFDFFPLANRVASDTNVLVGLRRGEFVVQGFEVLGSLSACW